MPPVPPLSLSGPYLRSVVDEGLTGERRPDVLDHERPTRTERQRRDPSRGDGRDAEDLEAT